jgi:type IV pilus assembly protein PilM
VEFAADRVTVVSLEGGGEQAVVQAHATEPLPPGVITPALNATNVEQPNAAGDALQRALERAGLRAGRAALVIPDAVARVSILPFETLPAERDLDQLVRWQVRKSVPFDIDAAQVSWSRGAAHDGGADVIVAAARRDLVEEYERLCVRCGLHAGLVDLASFCVINALLSAGSGPERLGPVDLEASDPGRDWMLVHVARNDATLAIVRDGQLIFFRHRAMAPDETLEDLVHQTAMYHEDRLGGGRFARVVVSGLSAGPEMRRRIEARIGMPIEGLDSRGIAVLRDRIGAAAGLFDVLAASVGVLRREVVA